MSTILNFIVNFVNKMGYLGLFVAMVLNGSIFPISSEVFIIPAGYLSSKGSFNLFLVIMVGSLGSLLGALINYFLGYRIGRLLIDKYGKFFGLNYEKILRGEEWFKRYGIYAVFLTRFIPTLRQYITVVPGILKMKLIHFIIFTLLGDIFVVTFLTLLGYFFGEYGYLVKPYLDELYIAFISILIIFLFSYVLFLFFKKRKMLKN